MNHPTNHLTDQPTDIPTGRPTGTPDAGDGGRIADDPLAPYRIAPPANAAMRRALRRAALRAVRRERPPADREPDGANRPSG